MSTPQPDSRSGMRFKELYTLDKVVSFYTMGFCLFAIAKLILESAIYIGADLMLGSLGVFEVGEGHFVLYVFHTHDMHFFVILKGGANENEINLY